MIERQDYTKKIKNLLYPSGFQYDRFQKLRISQFIKQCGSNSLIVEVGSRKRHARGNIINLDISYSPDVDLLADGGCLPFKNGAITGMMIRGVLEHISRPQVVMNEIYRSLKDKGRVYIEVPFMQGFHADPGDYQRYTLDGLEQLCCSFNKIESGICGGPASATAWILQEFLSQLSSFGNVWLKRKMSILFGWMCLPLKYLDFFMYSNSSAKIISSGFYFVGEKNAE
jgi:hypothetical protein